MPFLKKRSGVNKPLKILHLFDFYLPQTMNWAHALLRNTPGVEHWIAAPWMVSNAYFDPGFRFFTRDLQRMFRCIPTHERALRRVSTNLIRLERIWPFYKNWLRLQIENDRPDVLHAHFAPAGCHYLDLARQLNIPLLVSFYGYDFKRLPFQKPRYRQLYQNLFQQAAAFTTTGPFTLKYLEEQGCPPGKITPVPLSLEVWQFPWNDRLKAPGQLHLVQIATITEKKGHLDTLEALRRVLPACPGIHLTIAGERQDKMLVQKMNGFIKANRMEQHVTWLDAIPHDALPLFLHRFHVFIHPSHQTACRDSEGSPVSIAEAQATGMPVISTIHADIPAVVLHGITGLLSAENEPDALAQSIKRFYLMENHEYQQFSRQAHQHILHHFDVRATGKKLRQLYSSLNAV